MLPGFIAGSLLTFIRAIDDLGTPLMLNYKNLLAPQAYLRITTIGMDDVDGYVVCVVLVVLSLASLLAARKYLSLAEYATVQRSAPIAKPLHGKSWRSSGLSARSSWASACCRTSASCCCRSPKSGALRCCRRPTRSDNYEEILFRVPHFVINTSDLYAARRGARYRAWRRHRVSAAAQPGGGKESSRRHRHHAAGDSRRRARGRLSARFSRLGFSRRRRAADLLLADSGDRLHHAPAALHRARLLRRAATSSYQLSKSRRRTSAPIACAPS